MKSAFCQVLASTAIQSVTIVYYYSYLSKQRYSTIHIQNSESPKDFSLRPPNVPENLLILGYLFFLKQLY